MVLTGLGRSGTTLACHLLNKLPDTVALAEPMTPGRFEGLSGEEACDLVERFYRRMRRRALMTGRVVTKHVGGKVPDNGFEDKVSEDGKRRNRMDRGEIEVGKDLSRDFYLIVKDPGTFTALLPNLVERFPCYAMVRNPLSVVASGGTLKRKRKKPPAAMLLDEDLARSSNNIADPVERRLHFLSWQFEHFHEHLPKENVIRYEDLVSSGGRALSVMVPAAGTLDEPLESKNLNALYDREQMLKMGEALLKSEGAYWRFLLEGGRRGDPGPNLLTPEDVGNRPIHLIGLRSVVTSKK